MNGTTRRAALAAMLLLLSGLLGGCFVQPDPTLEALTIDENAVPFGTMEPLPTPSPTAAAEATPSPTPDTWVSSDQSTWEDWADGALPTATPRTAATAAPDAQSWATSTEDYNAGYPVLRVGSTGSDVSDLQARLLELGYYTGTIDGKYSQQTQAAVQEFQTRNGLTADGVAGRQTQDLLYSGSAQPKTVSASASEQGYILLKQGASGLEVRKLQGRLAELGYYAGGVDGIYGESTVSAVKAFQRNNGLTGDGQAGEQTQSKLYSANARYADTPVATANPEQQRSLSLGMTGNDVYALQERLIELRYLSGVADGVYGAETQQAVAAYQSNNGLTADGVAGLSTLKKLAGSSRAASAATATPAPEGAAMREGDTGENVYALQERLFELGYYTGRVDGRFGADTAQAVKDFQSLNGLTVDGIAGGGTQSRLYGGSAVAKDAAMTATPAPQATEEPPTGTLSTLRKGDQNGDVRVLQTYLRDLGYLSTEPDGQFGSGTERAVKLFQEANGLTADGIAGKGTLSILYGGDATRYDEYFGPTANRATAVPAAQGGASAPAPTAKPNTDIVIQWQSEGEDVRQYQRRLVELGYLDSKNVTGKFNQPTVDATKAFQRNNGLKVDGAAGPESLKLIYSDRAVGAGVLVDSLPAGDGAVGSADAAVSEVLAAGMTGEDVLRVQRRLSELGYLPGASVSGVYDAQTQQAVRQFQQANGLSADGVAGSATQSRLYATGAVTAQVERVAADNTQRQNAEYRLNGAYQVSIGGGGIAVGDGDALYLADASQGGQLVKRPYGAAEGTLLSHDVPRFLHLTNGRLYYVASDGGEDCIIRLDTATGAREVLCRAGIVLRFSLHDGCLYYLDANAALRERTLSGEESELMSGVSDFSLDAQAGALLCVTQAGVVSFSIETGKTALLYAGYADQAAQCGQALLVRAGGNIVRVSGGESATIRRDGATFLGVYGGRVLQLTPRGVMSCDVNGENASLLLEGAFESVSVADGVLYAGTPRGYAQSVRL